ncbi:tyrosine-protein phosphatase [Flavobacterium soli]|uniref:tyrosine-protein phosphatase n=1 Tax=Flavobacterium soli TaxID=344881 RepID=UPI0003F89EFD|nr:CpsB/CapC family capsule biosynthesis tyrosine phosphatase [Flavobacterium soli]
MFFFKKNKTVLKDLIPENHIDIHSHLLFGIDDGAKTFEDTLALTSAMTDFGIKEFITTPHIIQHVWENNTAIISAKEDEVISLFQQNNISLPFKAAAEYLMDDHFVKLFQNENLLCLKDNYVLVEMSYINAPIQLYDILFDLQVAGYKPVLAHPERYLFYHKNFGEYTKLKKAGCLFQLNMLSIVGYYGESVFLTAKKLLENGMIDYVGSDVHHQKHIEAFHHKVDLKDLNPLKEVIANNQFFATLK